ncbi:MAG: conjugal transfer protein TraF [Ignavibacteria bacterium]|nr:conjugal transfer protein TraF [Ignavibacteria bacterium]
MKLLYKSVNIISPKSKRDIFIFSFIFIFVFFIKVSLSQFEFTDIGARAAALNGAFTSISDNSLAVFYNPSGLGQMKFREISFFYSPAPYGISELSTTALSYAEPTKFGTFGLGVKSYGFDLYKEITGLISYGNSYRNRIYYGLSFNLYHLSIKNYNSATSFGVDIGAMAQITNFLKWGFFAKNLTGSKIGQSKERIAQVYKTGFAIQPRDDLKFIIETEKDVKYPFSFKGAFEYSIFITNTIGNMPGRIDLRAGVGSEPTNFSAGIGLFLSLFQIDYAFKKHSDLGFTHQGTITINFGGVEIK